MATRLPTAWNWLIFLAPRYLEVTENRVFDFLARIPLERVRLPSLGG